MGWARDGRWSIVRRLHRDAVGVMVVTRPLVLVGDARWAFGPDGRCIVQDDIFKRSCRLRVGAQAVDVM